MTYAIVNRPVAGVYSEPDAAAELADEALYGHTVRILWKDGDRLRIRSHYGYEGFVAYGDLRIVTDKEAAARRSADLRAASARFLDVLTAPHIRAGRLACLPAGALLSVIGTAEDGWTAVRLADGAVGYVPARHLAEKRFADDGKDFSFAALLDRFYGGSEDAFRACLVAAAKTYLGTQYRWGGRSSFGVDCSGLASLAYMRAGVNIYRDARMEDGFPIRPVTGAPRAGDLLFFPGHVALYLGSERYIHATARAGANGVVINSLRPGAPDFRADLYGSLYAVGGVRREI